MKKNVLIIIGVLIITFSLSSCEEIFIREDFENTPVQNFLAFSNDFRNMYGAFDAKKIDWDSLTNVYSEWVSNEMSSHELFGIFKEMLNELNDGHADIKSIDHGHFRSWNRRNKAFFKGREGMDINDVVTMQNVIRTEYLNNTYNSITRSSWVFFYGTIHYEQSQVGYICIPTFNISDFPNSFIQQAVDEFNQLDAVIIDIRFNGGGRTEAFVSLHNRFGSEEKMYMKSKFRNGPELSDFSPFAEHWVRPHPASLKNKPIAILANAYSASSSDHFVVAMKSQPNVIFVGDTTFEAFSAVLERILPNGWQYRLGAQVVYEPEGNYLQDSNGNYLEGIGIAPDFWLEDDWSQILINKDAVLEKALYEIKGIN